MDPNAPSTGVSTPEARRLEAFASAAAAVAQSPDVDAALSRALDIALETLGLEAGGIYFVDEQTGALVGSSHHRGLPPDYAEAVMRFQRGEGLIGRALESVSPVAVRDIAATDGVRAATRQTGLRSVVFVPLHARGRAVGMVAMGAYRLRDFLAEELQLLAAFGGILGAAIENDRLVRGAREHLVQVQALWQTETRRASQLALLAGASEIAASTLDLDVMMGAVARYIQQSFGYYSVAIYVVTPPARSMVLAGAAGVAAQVLPLGDRIPFGRGIIGWVGEHGRYLLANDVRKEPRFFQAEMPATLSELAVPVRLAGDVVAVINVESDHLDAFDDGDLLALDGIAAQVASAIRNARLFEEKVRALRNLEILQEITNVLNSDLNVDALLERIARRSVEAVRAAQMGAVLLYDAGSLVVRSSYGYADDSALRRVHMEFHEGLPGSVFVSGQGRLVRSAPEDYGRHRSAFLEAAGGIERTSALCVPISLPQEKLGVLLLESGTVPDAFQAEDLRFAATLSHQAAIAIGNALRLHRMEEMDRQRQAYLSNVSHELRTPLTVVQGYIEALLSGVGADQSRQYLRIAQEQAQRLGRMIEEVLEVARMERGVAQRHLLWNPVALGDTVRLVVRTLRQEAVLKDIALEVCVAENLPPLVGDERLLQLLVMNLVENALKFSTRGGKVDIALSDAGDSVLLRVRDRGIGIPPEVQGRIFDKFFMVDGGAAKSRSGAGIGLYLAREVAAIHDGAIAVESNPGEGACFEVRLPLHPRASLSP
jgi:signal transduction histidine kinase/putative methionine-R-sulfoxide reductase with GAF domain